MSKNGFIDNVKVGSPCNEDWGKMRGNSQVRMCDHCVKEVTDLSTFTRKQAKRMVRASDGNICIRYAEHPVTKRPIFANQLHQITRRAPGIAAGVMTASMSFSTVAYAQGGSSDGPTRSTDGKTVDAIVAVQKLENDKQGEITESVSPVSNGTIEGTVTDSAGAVISGANITVVNIETQDSRLIVSNDDGFYKTESLAAGKYSIAVSSVGFMTTHIDNVLITSETEKVANARLEIGAIGGLMILSRDYSNALTRAVDNEDLDEVRNLIARGENVNGKDEEFDNVTPIFIAVENGSLEMTQTLLNAGAKVNVRNRNKQTALMQLDGEATAELVNLLVNFGAKLNLSDNDGNTALNLAAENTSTEVIEALIRAGADVNIANKEGVAPLMNAADKGDIESVRLLLNSGANINAKDEDGDNAWEYADDKEIEDLLISYGAESRFMEPEGNSDDDEKPIENASVVISL